jgi:hypothetical protein
MKFRDRDRVGFAFTFAAAAYNLARLLKLLAAARAAKPHQPRPNSSENIYSKAGA